MHSASLAVAELDCYISFASCAKDYNYIKPRVVAGACGARKGGWGRGGILFRASTVVP
jgi:DNA mismatch repair ATPase MutS